jgi:hypothetical protein
LPYFVPFHATPATEPAVPEAVRMSVEFRFDCFRAAFLPGGEAIIAKNGLASAMELVLNMLY